MKCRGSGLSGALTAANIELQLQTAKHFNLFL
jgi:hypothetical protein